MKILFIIIISLVIITQSGSSLPTCNFKTAQQALPPRIFAEITIDGLNQQIFITRFLHNKIGIITQELGKCYFNAIDPNFIYKSVSIFGLFFWGYFIYQNIIQKKWINITLLSLIPVLPFMNFPVWTIVYAHKVFAIIGLVFLVKKDK